MVLLEEMFPQISFDTFSVRVGRQHELETITLLTQACMVTHKLQSSSSRRQ